MKPKKLVTIIFCQNYKTQFFDKPKLVSLRANGINIKLCDNLHFQASNYRSFQYIDLSCAFQIIYIYFLYLSYFYGIILTKCINLDLLLEVTIIPEHNFLFNFPLKYKL